MCFGKCIIRTAVVGGLLVGVAAFAFPHHTAAAFHQLRGKVQSTVDQVIDDPVVLRERLQALAQKLPKKIAELRSEIVEVEGQIAQLERDSQVAEGVVAITTADLDKLEDVIVRAHDAQANGEFVQVRFDARRMDVADARQEYNRIHQIRASYADRLDANERDLKYLNEQKARLSDLLGKLEGEYATIETRMWQIDRKIEAIERNERLVEALEEREEEFGRFKSRFDIATLDQLEGKLRQWETEIEARFDAFDRRNRDKDYEDQVLWQLERQEQQQDMQDADFEYDGETGSERKGSSIVLGPRVIE